MTSCSTAAKGQKIQITSTRKRTSSDIYQNLADNVGNMNLDDAILAYFFIFLFILDYILRPRSVLPPGPVKDLYSVYMGIPLHSVFNIL